MWHSVVILSSIVCTLGVFVPSYDTMHERVKYNICFFFFSHEPMNISTWSPRHMNISTLDSSICDYAAHYGWSSSLLLSAARREDAFLKENCGLWLHRSGRSLWFWPDASEHQSSFNILELLDSSLQPATWSGISLSHWFTDSGLDLIWWRCDGDDDVQLFLTTRKGHSVFVQESTSIILSLLLVCGAEMDMGDKAENCREIDVLLFMKSFLFLFFCRIHL